MTKTVDGNTEKFKKEQEQLTNTLIRDIKALNEQVAALAERVEKLEKG
jgi:ubiquinone biosynthesis protein UbiJ